MNAEEERELMLMSEHAIAPPWSPAAKAVWSAFSEDEPGIFFDYGNRLANAIRTIVSELQYYQCCEEAGVEDMVIASSRLLELADEFDVDKL